MNWFRFYHDALDNIKVQRLPLPLFKTWINLLCVASKTNGQRGTLPSMDHIAFALRISEADAEAMTAALIEAGLIDRGKDGLVMHDWGEFQYVSDNATERVKRFKERSKQRSKQRSSNVSGNVSGNVAGNTPERKKEQRETEQNQKNNSPKRNYSSGEKEALAPARSLTLEARARSPASEQHDDHVAERNQHEKREQLRIADEKRRQLEVESFKQRYNLSDEQWAAIPVRQ